MGRKKKVEFDYKIMIKKGLKAFIIFSIPVLINQFVIEFPAISQLTLGGALQMLANYIKIKANT